MLSGGLEYTLLGVRKLSDKTIIFGDSRINLNCVF